MIKDKADQRVMKWLGHVECMSEDQMTKNVCELVGEGHRRPRQALHAVIVFHTQM